MLRTKVPSTNLKEKPHTAPKYITFKSSLKYKYVQNSEQIWVDAICEIKEESKLFYIEFNNKKVEYHISQIKNVNKWDDNVTNRFDVFLFSGDILAFIAINSEMCQKWYNAIAQCLINMRSPVQARSDSKTLNLYLTKDSTNKKLLNRKYSKTKKRSTSAYNTQYGKTRSGEKFYIKSTKSKFTKEKESEQDKIQRHILKMREIEEYYESKLDSLELKYQSKIDIIRNSTRKDFDISAHQKKVEVLKVELQLLRKKRDDLKRNNQNISQQIHNINNRKTGVINYEFEQLRNEILSLNILGDEE